MSQPYEVRAVAQKKTKAAPPVARPRRQQARRITLIMLLLALTGFGLFSAGRHLWAEYHFRAAQKELERHALAAAQQHLMQCLAIWPDSADACLLAVLAISCLQLHGAAPRRPSPR